MDPVERMAREAQEARTLLGVGAIVRAGEGGADHSSGHSQPSRVGQKHLAADGVSRLRYGAGPERLQLLVVEIAHTAVGHLALPRRRQRKLRVLKVGVHSVSVADRRGVDKYDMVDQAGVAAVPSETPLLKVRLRAGEDRNLAALELGDVQITGADPFGEETAAEIREAFILGSRRTPGRIETRSWTPRRRKPRL